MTAWRDFRCEGPPRKSAPFRHRCDALLARLRYDEMGNIDGVEIKCRECREYQTIRVRSLIMST